MHLCEMMAILSSGRWVKTYLQVACANKPFVENTTLSHEIWENICQICSGMHTQQYKSTWCVLKSEHIETICRDNFVNVPSGCMAQCVLIVAHQIAVNYVLEIHVLLNGIKRQMSYDHTSKTFCTCIYNCFLVLHHMVSCVQNFKELIQPYFFSKLHVMKVKQISL